MLKTISLVVIDKIFEEAAKHIKLSALAKQLYINALIRNFKGKVVEKENSFAFQLNISEITNYDKFENLFGELEVAKLVNIDNESIQFINRWSIYMDQSIFEKKSTWAAVGMNNKASIFVNQMIEDGELYSVVSAKYSIAKDQFINLCKLFVIEKDLEEVNYISYKAIKKDFVWYCQYNKPVEVIKKVISTAAVLGKN